MLSLFRSLQKFFSVCILLHSAVGHTFPLTCSGWWWCCRCNSWNEKVTKNWIIDVQVRFHLNALQDSSKYSEILFVYYNIYHAINSSLKIKFSCSKIVYQETTEYIKKIIGYTIRVLNMIYQKSRPYCCLFPLKRFSKNLSIFLYF